MNALRDVGVEVMSVDSCSDAECAAEGAALAAWRFQELKNASKRKPELDLILYGSDQSGSVKNNRSSF